YLGSDRALRQPRLQIVGEIHKVAGQIPQLRRRIRHAFARVHLPLRFRPRSMLAMVERIAAELLPVALFDELAHRELPALRADGGASSDSCPGRAPSRPAEH